MARKEKLQKPVKVEKTLGNEAGSGKRKYRAKPGTQSLREVRRQQKSTTPLLKKTPMNKIIRDIAKDVQFFPGNGAPRFSPGAIEALIAASEAKIVHFMRSINYIACQRGGKTITLKDVKTFKALEKITPV